MKNYDHRSHSFFITLPVIIIGLLLLPVRLLSQDLDVPYVPTPHKVVERMLDVAGVTPSDYVIDLGSGDGRIVIAAAQRGATGHGIDLDPKRIAEARRNAKRQEVDDRLMFIEGNIFNRDFSRASVITMYLLPTINEKLRPMLLDKLEPGTRVVSHSFDMDEWQADKTIKVQSDDGGSHSIYYWVIPARAEGRWRWKADNRNFTLTIDQRFQEIQASLSDNRGRTYRVEKATLHADRITVRATQGGKNYIFSGRIEGGSISGTMQVHDGDAKTYSTWSARKQKQKTN